MAIIGKQIEKRRAAWIFALSFSLLIFTGQPLRAGERANLALHKPASSSSVENDEHSAARANDGDPETSWCADDEPEAGPEWWLVDLEKTCELSGCQVRWPFSGKNYRYKVEGSTDRKDWTVLSDQTSSISKKRVQSLTFPQASRARYVKITVTGFDEGCWASIAEVKVFGIEPIHRNWKR
jgi:alpha-L-fucosidase